MAGKNMTRSAHAPYDPRATRPLDIEDIFPLYRTHDWLGRERVSLHAHGRRRLYRSLDDALRARAGLARADRTHRARRSRRRGRRLWIQLPLAALLLLGLALWLFPPLLLRAVDLARDIAGPAPVAYVESAAFRIGTLIREARVRLGDTAPRWTVEGAAPPIANAAPVAEAPATRTPTATPTTLPTAQPGVIAASTPPPTAPPTAPPTEEPAIGAGAIVRGGNLRSEPRVADATIAGLVWAGDQIAFLERRVIDGLAWYRIRLIAPAAVRGGEGVAAGTTGWISSALLTRPAPTPTPQPAILPTPGPAVPPQPRPTAAPSTGQAAPPANPAPSDSWTPGALAIQIADGQVPGEGEWSLLPALGDGGSAAMAVTTLRPDPARPDIQAAIVAVDLARARLHMVAGLQEPPGAPESVRTGAIAAEELGSGRLLAAFNGGFKAIHGNDGMGVDGVTYMAPVERRAAIVITGDGGVRVGLWGRDFHAGDSLQAWRQNGYLLVDGGVVTDRARAGGLGWGTTVDLQAETWRSGVGVSADGRTLLYAVGDALTAERLAEVLRAAGAWNALQLDINNYWVRFVTFQRGAGDNIFAQPLISAMPREPGKYLGAEERDFMYLTAR
jgi:hypothetical protein